MSKIYWTTKEGKKIWIRDMEDSHLDNCIKFLQRKIRDYPGYEVYTGSAEMAEMTVEQENEDNLEHLFACQKAVETLEREQKRRLNQGSHK